ncbi:MAG TPA: 4Fe-4S dicluster domain-containing protein [Symbiobacteriaceae bacterium]|nr:4Fe-4S dicluster domain-containing protein [Symbiobacteriaceae bacterium]
MTRYAYFVDLSICAGCESCTVACQNKNGLEPEQVYTRVKRNFTGAFPKVASTFVTTQCMHCENPPCTEVCPTGASYKSAEGPVIVEESKCIDCKYCMTACPYDARIADEDDRVVKKCTMCLDRLQQGKSPACVQTCLTGARLVGDLDDPQSPIHEALKRPNTVQIAGTSFFYRLPDGYAREVLPADFAGSGITFAWQSIFQPVGQMMLVGVTGALLTSVVSNAIAAMRKKGGEPHGDH